MEKLVNDLELAIRIIAGATAALIVVGALLYFKLLKDVFDLKRKVEKLEKKVKE